MMTKTLHISDAELQLAATGQSTDTPTETIENHIADCKQCQARLLELSADSKWRDEFTDELKNIHRFSPFAFVEAGSNANSSRRDDGYPAPPGDEFDLQTVDQMLDEVLQSPTHPEMLGRLGRYEVESVIGCGGMGVVLKGFDRELHRPVAIKMILPRLSKNGTAKHRFLREARSTATVLHPNVIGIHDINESAGVPWFVMPLVVGPSLQTLVEGQGPLPERDIVRIGLQIAGGLAAAHSKGLVHRDIKPANILVDNQVNRVVITDFGLARCESEEAMTQTGVLAGTLNYMSPEQSRGDDIDGRSDLFSLGGVLYYLSTGVTPFQSSAPMRVLHKIRNEEHNNVQGLNSEVSHILSDAIGRLLAKSPDHRFQTASGLESFLNDYLAHLHRPTQMPAPKVPVVRDGKVIDRFAWSMKKTVGLALLLLIPFLCWLPFAFWPGATETTGSVEPAAIWSEIKARHGIDNWENFDQQLLQLGRDFDRAQHSQADNALAGLPRSSTGVDHALADDMQKLSGELKQLSNHLETMKEMDGHGK